MSENISQNITVNDENLVISNAAVIYPSTHRIINYEISAGDIVSGYILSSGSTLTTLSGGSSVDITLSTGAVQYISSGGVDEGAFLSYNTKQYVNGGTVNGAQIGTGVFDYPQSGTEYTTIESSGSSVIYSTTFPATEQYVINGGVVNSATIIGGSYYAYVPAWVSGVEHSNLFTAPVNQYISNGGTANYTIISGGVQYIYSGGIANNTLLDQPEQFVKVGDVAQSVCSGGIANNTSINFSNAQEVMSGGIANITDLYRGSQTVYGMANSTSIYAGGQIVYGSANNTYIGSIMSQTYDNGGMSSNVIIKGSQTIYSNGVASNTIISGGDQILYGSTIGETIVASLGTIYVKSSGHLGGNVTIASGGALYLDSKAYLESNIALNLGGSMTIGLSNGGSVDLIGDTNRGLIISGYTAGVNTSVSTMISGFSGQDKTSSDKIMIDGLQTANVSSVAYPDDDHITLTLLDGTSFTLNMIGIKQTGYSFGSDVDGNLTFAVCFLSGTIIRLIDGHCAIEDIKVGDTILTYDAQVKKKVSKKVTWVGKKRAHINSKLPDDQAGYPVRILKDTFKKNVPNKDLLITPEHCLFIDGYFIPARMLVNGRSIFYDYSITSYDYYHVETENHSIIWADNMLTESYLNTGNRYQFNRDKKVVTLDRQIKDWDKDAAAPLMVERSIVEPIFNKLVKRADRQKLLFRNNHKFVMCNDHGLYLLTESGEEIYQNRVDNNQIVFKLPANTQGVYLVSKKSRPCDVIGPFVDDRRYLGVLVGKVSVLNEYGAYPLTQYMKKEDLQGWSVIEQAGYRWTQGCAFLPLDVYNIDYDFELAIQIVNAGPYLVKKVEKDKEEVDIDIAV